MSAAPKPVRKTARVAMVGLDEPAAALLGECFQHFGIATAALRSEEAERMYTEKFDAGVLYLDDTAERVLEIARNAPANVQMIIYGLAADPAQAARYLRYGINVILETPLRKEDAFRAVRATHLFVVREFRRYLRLPLVTAVQVHCEGQQLAAIGVEISNGGMLLQLGSKLPVGLSVELKFGLPNTAPVRLTASIRWARNGKAGVRFNEDEEARSCIKQWMDKYLGIP